MILATDLDRTLLPNGKDKDDGSLPLLLDLIVRNKIILVYVSGRDLRLLKQAMDNFKIPIPDYFISDVGATLYKRRGDKLVIDNNWRNYILQQNKAWQREKIKNLIFEEGKIFLQKEEKQSEFKISFYVKESKDFGKADVLDFAREKISEIQLDANLIYSFDPIIGLGLLDILPSSVSKNSALEFLRRELRVEYSDIIYAGDSGNDILPLSGKWRSIIVKNASAKVKAEVLAYKTKNNSLKNLYIAKGVGDLNGNYSSGIIEGLKHFGVVK